MYDIVHWPIFYLTVTCDPFQDKLPFDNDSITIIGYVDPALEGATLAFECPPQYILIGPNTTTCMGDGEWEPDPREIECKGMWNLLLKWVSDSTIMIIMLNEQ